MATDRLLRTETVVRLLPLLAAAYLVQCASCPAAVRDVINFGATPNDATDDAAAIQKALDAAAEGDTVSLPRGTLLVNRTLRAKSGVRIQGAAADLTIFKFNGVTQADFFDLSGTRKVELSGFTLEGNHNPNAHHGIFGHGGGGHWIHHLTIQNLGSLNGPLGIHFTGDGKTGRNGVTGCVIADNAIRNIGLDSPWGGGIRLSWGSSSNVILRNVVDHTGRGGIFANDSCTDLVISSNRVTRSGRKAEKLGLEIWGGCDRVVMEDNQVDHWLSIGGGRWVAARRNSVCDTSGDIAFIGIEVIAQDVVVTDNLVEGGQQIGVSVSNNASNQWQYCAYNTIRNMVQWGAQLQGDQAGARMLYFYKNKFLATQRGNPAAIYPGADGRGFRFNGNFRFEDRLSFTIRTLEAAAVWPVEAEEKAQKKLASLIPADLFEVYMLTGHFPEISKRSQLTYLFRRGRPTIVLRQNEEVSYPLCALCLHPIGYYGDTWAGVMCPTDEVIAHLLMMRGSEEKYWANANQHPIDRPAAGV
jgi:hypothetical protein